ncbi:flavodoxin family protein [Lentilactobacillus kisonensis]|uniref:Uncharacterized protein n=2 Tax=Lentilactobacillus kisonensis TaxID=481722 RepID=H1LG64_9LACO|nr:flavodoxin family protein [Lentilactobacillus kisonensis]EHO51076.1 hypothetical protein HMPREF9104_01590 [Lentilactobacillus kisonensis F0435]KRL23393.1 hypothetical protein FC98_GL000119 [Lentilactobacillus kisonensis DSM 19906 = JCM 15041]
MDAIRYYSRTGNTKKLANMLGDLLKIESKSIEVPIDEPVNRLYLGGGIYNMNVDEHLKTFTSRLDPHKVTEVFLFGTSGSLFTVGKQLGKILDEKGIKVSSDHLFLHGLMPKLGNINKHQQEEVKAFVKETVIE